MLKIHCIIVHLVYFTILFSASFPVISQKEYLHLWTNWRELAAVLPMHICLRSSVLQLSLPGWDSEEPEVAEPVPYNTRRNWVRVPEHRHGWRHKTELTPEEKSRCVMMGPLHVAAPLHFFWLSAQSDRKCLLETCSWIMKVFWSSSLWRITPVSSTLVINSLVREV